jgi:type IV pilus assembly protein PilX
MMSDHTCIRGQRGAVLIVSLLFLVVLTMLGVTAMTGTTFEERMAGNARDASVAQHSAEAALRRARDMIIGQTAPPPLEGNFTTTTDPAGLCVAGLCTPRPYVRDTIGAVPPEIPQGVDWSETSNSGGTTKPYATSSDADVLRGVSKQSRYIIEMFCMPLGVGSIEDAASQCRFWRFTAVGWGKNPNTQVTVQEVYLSDPKKK